MYLEEALGSPYFRARKHGAEVRATGTTHAVLGRRLESPDGRAPGGIFAQWTWDGSRLVVENDRYGFFPLFYYCDGDAICVSPSLVKLLEQNAPTDLNIAGLAVFLRIGHFLCEDTPFKAIRALPPGARLEWADGSTTLTSRGPVIRKSLQVRYSEAIDAYAELFRAAIRRQAPFTDRFVTTLSGGRDSRHILLALCEAGYAPQACLTCEYWLSSHSEDLDIAAQLCRRLKLEHIVLPHPTSRFDLEVRKNVLTHFCADEHAGFVPIRDAVAGRWELVYDGLGGDVLSAGLLLDERSLSLYEAEAFEDLASSLLSEGYLPRLLQADAYQACNRDLAIQQLAGELRRYADAPNPLGAFYFYNRTRRKIAVNPFGILGDVATVLTPYLDADLYDFLASLPASMLLDHEFHTRTIQRAYPHCADVPFARKQSPSPAEYKRYRHLAWEVARYALGGTPSRLVRRPVPALSLLRCMLDRTFGTEAMQIGEQALYLLQLERTVNLLSKLGSS